MKTISVIVPVYNEESNIADIYRRTTGVMESLSDYDYELIFVNDGSTDRTGELVEHICQRDNRVKAIFNTRNFGYSKNIFYGMQQATGDCAVLLHADLQNPPELIPEFVKAWESGAKAVLGVKTKSNENKLLYFFRSCYYFLMKKISDAGHIPHATDFELLDRSFLDILRSIKVNYPYLRGFIMEYGGNIRQIEYVQDKRRKGKTHFNFYKYYDFAMLGITSLSKKLLRLSVFIGVALAAVSGIWLIAYIIASLIGGLDSEFSNGLLLRILFFVGSLQLIFTGFLGEYIFSIHENSQNKPLVTEEKRINF